MAQPSMMTEAATPERADPPRGVRGSGCRRGARRRARLVRAAGQRFRRPPVPERPARGPRLRDLEQLLVRGPLQLRHLQPPLLPARGAVRDQAARRRERRHGGARLRASSPRGNGARPRAGRTAPSPSSGRASSSPAPSRSPSGIALALLALWALQAGGAGASRCSPSSRSPRARSRSSSSRVVLAGIAARPVAAARASSALPLATVALATRSSLLLRRLFPTAAASRSRCAEFAAALRLLRLRDRAHVARAAARHAPLDLRRLPRAPAPPRSSCRRALGENVARLRYAAIPIAILTLSLRRWRPLPVALAAMALAVSWNLTPLAASFVEDERGPGGGPGVLGAGGAVPPRAPRAVLPRRGGRHRRPLARRLPPGRRHPDRARLVPAGRLPAQRPALHATRPRRATSPGCARSASATSSCPTPRSTTASKAEGALIISGRSGLRVAFRSAAHDDLRRPLPARHRDGPRQGARCSRWSRTASRSRSAAPGATASRRTGRRTGTRAAAASRRETTARCSCSRNGRASCGSSSRSTRSVLSRLWKAARSVALADRRRLARLLPRGEREASQRAVAEHVHRRVVDEQRDGDPGKEREHRRTPAPPYPEPDEPSEREQAEEGRVRGRGCPAHEIRSRRSRSSSTVPGPPPTASVT